MKKLISVITLVGLLITTNGCGILKTKHIEKSSSIEKVNNDIATSKLTIDDTKNDVVTSKSTSSTIQSEEITVKRPEPNDIEIIANFRMDTSATLKGDTLKLVDVKNNNISLSVYQNGKTKELMAKVTTSAGSRVTPFSEISIKRQYTNTESKTDSVASFENHSELKADSIDKTETVIENKNLNKDKEKSSTPNFWIWAVGIVVAATLIFFLVKK